MDPFWIALAGLGVMLVLMVLEVPIGVAMGLTGIVGFAALTGAWAPALSLVGTEIVDVFTSQTLVTIPLFLLMGGFAARADMSRDMFNLASAFLGHRRGGMAMATVLGCAGFGSICGSSLATVGAFTSIAVPEMKRRGYSAELTSGSVAAAGTLGILIPPSIVMIIYASLADVSIVEMFAAAVVPSLIAVVLQLVAVYLYVLWKGDAVALGQRMSWRERGLEILRSWAIVLLVFIIFAAIYGGIFTVNESAALGALLAFLVAWGRGKLNFRDTLDVLRDCAANTAMVFTVIIGALIFAYFVSVSQMPRDLVALIKATELPGIWIVSLLLVMYLVLGSVFDETAAMMLTMPFVLPLILGYGYDPIWWGIINVTIIELGLIIPPIGMNVFLLNTIMPEYKLTTIYRGVMPFIGADLVRLAILTAFPILTLYVPHLLR